MPAHAGNLDPLTAHGPVPAQPRPSRGICHLVDLGHPAAPGQRTGRVRAGEAGPHDVLAGRAGGHRGQHAGRRHQLVDGLWRRDAVRTQEAQAV